MNSEQCAEDIYRNGSVVGIYSMTKDEAEAYCKAQSEATGDRYDWHYSAGRVVVKMLPAAPTAPTIRPDRK